MTNKDKPISEVIRDRLIAADAPFFSTDNISEHITDEERDLLQKEVQVKFQAVLESLVIDTKNDHNTNETAKRVAKMYLNEIFAGRYDARPIVTEFPNVTKYDQLYIVGPVEIRSFCAHHMMPITGYAYIGVFPGTNVVGLSKFHRLAQWIAERPSIQEEMTTQIADEVEKATLADGVAVVIKAEHGCMTLRGVKSHASDMLTSVMRGKFRDDNDLKAEFLNLLTGMKGFSKN